MEQLMVPDHTLTHHHFNSLSQGQVYGGSAYNDSFQEPNKFKVAAKISTFSDQNTGYTLQNHGWKSTHESNSKHGYGKSSAVAAAYINTNPM